MLFDERGAPQLADFGLARIERAERLTATGTLIGTPAYMSPEQASGEPLDERADVYGLGAVLYQALTGSPPYAGEGTFAVLNQVLRGPPPPPQERRARLPAGVCAVCVRAMAHAPEDRYPSAAALAEDLERVIRGEDPLAAASARRGWAAAAGLVALAAALTGGAALTLARPPVAATPGR
ncbi:MAG: serine/threonine-protein kinase [Planctomycetota bacterium]